MPRYTFRFPPVKLDDHTTLLAVYDGRNLPTVGESVEFIPIMGADPVHGEVIEVATTTIKDMPTKYLTAFGYSDFSTFRQAFGNACFVPFKAEDTIYVVEVATSQPEPLPVEVPEIELPTFPIIEDTPDESTGI